MPPLPVSRLLADYVANSQWRDIPPAVRREGVRGLLNYVGCALGGCGDEAMGLAIRVLAPTFGAPQAGIIGRSERCDMLNATFLNAASANVLEYDDTHLPTVMHPAAPVAPGLFALAEARGASGQELLHAFILGVEVSCRVGNGLMPHHYRRGAHITATCGIFGAAAVASDTVDLAKMTAGLGDKWEILANAYKPYPCGVVLFPVIDACLELRKRITVPVGDIARVVVRGHPLLRERTDRPDANDGRIAKVSLQHSIAIALLQGTAGIAQFTDAAVADPAVQALRAKVTAEDDASIPVEAAVVEVRFRDGSSLSEHVKDGRGTPSRPMSDLELDAKVNECAAFGAPSVDVAELIAALRDLETLGDAAHIMRMTVPF
jgi:2-methylcitrate dehydratase PrpD